MKKILLISALGLFFLPMLASAQETQPKLDKKNLVIKEWNTDPKGGHKALDHVTTYNPEGQKIEEIEYNADGQKWRKRFERDAAGKVTTEYVYDGKNRLQTYKKFEYNQLGRKKVQYTYNAKGRLLTVKNYEYIAQPAD
ncbi:MAG: hypothetical protein IK074_06665 [Bacteroidales bacterium]|nr:hypothetical protein [Bacteroidales bacterium]